MDVHKRLNLKLLNRRHFFVCIVISHPGAGRRASCVFFVIFGATKCTTYTATEENLLLLYVCPNISPNRCLRNVQSTPCRDLKPSNIGLCAEGHVKLFDLGLSVVQEVREGSIDQKYEVRVDPPSSTFSSCSR